MPKKISLKKLKASQTEIVLVAPQINNNCFEFGDNARFELYEIINRGWKLENCKFQIILGFKNRKFCLKGE